MIKITKVSVQKRSKERYNIFIDRGQGEEYGFSVDEDILIKIGLRKGLEIEEDELKEILDKDEEKKTHHLALHFLSYRMRSVKEMMEYLQKKERESKHIDTVVKRLLDQNLLNDEMFAASYIESKKLTLLKGPLKLKQELSQKGVGQAHIETALEGFTEDEQIDKLIKWIAKKESRKPKQSVSAYKQKLAGQLMNKGFTHSIIEQAMREVTFEVDNEEEWEALTYQASKLKRKYSSKYEGYEYLQRMKQALYQKGFPIDMINEYLSRENEDDMD
ncbi:recombination regulator RecX [Alkalihalophilus pseudofirmus]|uniref:Regulatory protein RecX n=1 Tax=Alkalihalophilus pseudofirmus TaxID=79885 RepID=A0AAJ2U3M1_ALKPS|nr:MULTISPECIES: recombination regulator RecX [Alkalihalophilus]MDV2886546.1 recombination regulator RecX [Alkalihalophilus pseudofirmus]MED1599956.1 recombination regulator RecX [Alkalihalophilus marmarensis]OLS34299.1 recombination regulator RecX [Alkalihalophilus pseudofirmus]